MSSLGLFRRNRWLHVAAALLLVLGTSMPGLAHMSCLMGCTERWSIGELEDCCAAEHESEEAQFMPTCCEVDEFEALREDYVAQGTIQFQVPVAYAVTPEQPAAPITLSSTSTDHILWRPPPLSGSFRAISNCTLLL
jgi:hypothetical protein